MNIDIDNKTFENLQNIAAMQNTSVSDLLRVYASEQKAFIQEKTKDQETWEASGKGDYIDNDTVMKWLENWGTDNETSCPTIK